MLNEFWKSVASKLGDRWAATAGPALVFWIGGLLVWAVSGGGPWPLDTVSGWISEQATVVQVAVLIAALCGVVASGIVVRRLGDPVLRLMEGYWPRWAAAVRRRRVQSVAEAKRRRSARLRELAPVVRGGGGTSEEQGEFIRLDRERRRVPSAEARLMPTRIGNVLRAGESRPADKYGLDLVAVWPQWWLVLPDTARQELLAARGALDSAVGAVVWGTAFIGFAPLAWWAAPAGFLVAVAAWRSWVPRHAEAFSDLLEATADVHRWDLYEKLRWPRPQSPAQEREFGRRLTMYLVRGSDEDDPTFTE
ncbi:hypothetical protein [Streptomyces sp. NPDC058964]|uniref:hypothetical protein n=1 Tax=Streptomyces sp. NPDC058964 TaxID=3346681 RepID=UPI003680315C